MRVVHCRAIRWMDDGLRGLIMWMWHLSWPLGWQPAVRMCCAALTRHFKMLQNGFPSDSNYTSCNATLLSPQVYWKCLIDAWSDVSWQERNMAIYAWPTVLHHSLHDFCHSESACCGGIGLRGAPEFIGHPCSTIKANDLRPTHKMRGACLHKMGCFACAVARLHWSH